MLSGSISKAAELLHVSQPAISRLLSHTESRIGFVLFERIKGRLCPTPEARRLYVEVENVYQGVQRVHDLVVDLADKRHGSLHIAASHGLGQTLIPRAVALFRQRLPGVKVFVRTLIAAELVDALVTQQAEVGVSIVPLSHPSLHSEALFSNHLVAVLPAAHPLADKEQLHTDDLQNEDLIGFGPDTPYGRLVQKLFDNKPGLPRLAVEVRLTHNACAMVQAGVGIAIVDELAVMGRVWPDVVVRPILPTTKMAPHLLYSNVAPVSLLAKDFRDILRAISHRDIRTNFQA